MRTNAGEAVGAVLNRQWKLVRMIGEGGLAAVYEAHGQNGKRAIKLLHSHFVTMRAIVERFYAEAKACFSLRHPHIASVEEYAYAEDGTPYMVMELLEGMSLEEYLKKGKPLPPEQAAPILYGILQALSCAHSRGIVHRDLKPANLFLVPSGNDWTVKVLDFGIAKVMDLAGGIGSKTRTGAVLGTPGYMSPEQVKNAKAVDSRTDLWAAGVVFYEMLTCKHPYGNADQLARMVAVLRDAYTPMAQTAPALAHWEPFFERSLAKEPEQRFQSAEEMAERLRAIAQGTPARFVAEGLQTVAIPMMPDRRIQSQPPSHPSTPAPQHRSAPPPATHASATPVAAHASAHGSTPPPAEGGRGRTELAMPMAPIAVAAVAAPASGPAPAYGAYVYGGPPAANPAVRAAGATQVSAERPTGMPTQHSDLPAVQVETALDEEPASLVWWGVLLVALGTFAAGILVGYMIASS
jgi:eukaryotic-like serine/threonine-protein kinase